MSPEIQELLHKSRSRINNLYLLTRPIDIPMHSKSREIIVSDAHFASILYTVTLMMRRLTCPLEMMYFHQ